MTSILQKLRVKRWRNEFPKIVSYGYRSIFFMRWDVLNDCVIFRKEFADHKKRPKCGSSRFKCDGKTTERNFSYIPLVQRIRRLFASKNTYELLTEHLKTITNEGKNVRDIHDSTTWKTWFSKHGEFKGNKHSIVLSICLDGVNPFSLRNINYSFWPIELCIENFPAKLLNTSAGRYYGPTNCLLIN